MLGERDVKQRAREQRQEEMQSPPMTRVRGKRGTAGCTHTHKRARTQTAMPRSGEIKVTATAEPVTPRNKKVKRERKTKQARTAAAPRGVTAMPLSPKYTRGEMRVREGKDGRDAAHKLPSKSANTPTETQPCRHTHTHTHNGSNSYPPRDNATHTHADTAKERRSARSIKDVGKGNAEPHTHTHQSTRATRTEVPQRGGRRSKATTK